MSDLKIQENNNRNYKNNFILLLLVYGSFQFILHLSNFFKANDPKLIFPVSIAFIHDILILTIYLIFSLFTIRYFPIKFNNLVRIILKIGFIILGVILSLYPGMLREYLIFPSNIFESDMSTARTLIFEYLGFSALIIQLIAIIVGIAAGFMIKKEVKINKKLKYIFLFILLLLAVFTSRQTSPQPLLYSIQMQVESIIKNEKRVVPSLIATKKENHNLISTIIYPKTEIFNYNHVLMIVMEGVTSNSFEQEFLTIPDGFYFQNLFNSNYYHNYFSNNLDSYTSLISMISGIQVPYRSYADIQLFEKVNHEKNIVDYLNNNGFRSLFISTFEYQPFIPSKDFWNNIFIRKDFDVTNYTTIGSSRMEKATEDKAAINKIVKYMKNNHRTFILHELAYGHSPEWRATMGKSQLKYYNEYLIELSDKLKNDSIFDKTLIITVSDHGDRSKISDMENYRVPLLIVGNNPEGNYNNKFYSHLDLPSIIFSYLNNQKQAESRNEIFTVGSSEKWTYGYISKSKEYLFINDAKGTILSKSSNVNPMKISRNFQNYVNEFNLKYGK